MKEEEVSLPPPKYDPERAYDDMQHHLAKSMTPTSFVPQRHVMMALGRPVVALTRIVSPADCSRFQFIGAEGLVGVWVGELWECVQECSGEVGSIQPNPAIFEQIGNRRAARLSEIVMSL